MNDFSVFVTYVEVPNFSNPFSFGISDFDYYAHSIDTDPNGYWLESEAYDY